MDPDVLDESDESEPQHRVFELLGAPSLLFRNHHAYSTQHEPLSAVDPSSQPGPTQSRRPVREALAQFQEAWNARHRAQARFYYPVDYPAIQTVVPRLPSNFVKKILPYRQPGQPRKRQPRSGQRHVDEDDDDASASSISVSTESSANSSANDAEAEKADEKKGSTELADEFGYRGDTETINYTLDDWRYLEQQSLMIQQKARAHMLLVGVEEHDLQARYEAREKLRAYQRYDVNYLPAKLRRKTWSGFQMKSFYGGVPLKCKLAQLYDRERANRADPAYLAPWHCECLEEAAVSVPSASRRKRKPAYLDYDGPLAVQRRGNSLLCFSCECGTCKQRPDQERTNCLLHPVGPLLEYIRLSFLKLPHSESLDPTGYPSELAENVLKIGNTVTQLIQCGPLTFVARAGLYCCLFKITFVKPINHPDERCWGSAKIAETQRMDFRSLSLRLAPSFLPVDATAHPRYGNQFSGGNVAVLFEDVGRRGTNTIRHLQVNVATGAIDSSNLHHISNLQDVAQIEFTSHHPMVLWASGRAFVRPALTRDHLSHYPRAGHGHSLYSVDFRTDQGTLQWSPSAEEYVIEGVHSLSGIQTDWSKQHSVWVASLSAMKTWELDARMPCKAVCSWSLPHACDGGGATMPHTGIFGSRMLFSFPPTFDDPLLSRPMLGLGTNPGSFGLHIYQQPEVKPRFQTRSLESTSCPGLATLGGASIAASQVFPLPDISEKVFACGMATLRAPISCFLGTAEQERIGHSPDSATHILCVIHLTSRGDLYLHTMVESMANQNHARAQEGCPVGTTSIYAPSATTMASWTGTYLTLSLSNEFPLPSHALVPDMSMNAIVKRSLAVKRARKGEASRSETKGDHTTDRVRVCKGTHSIPSGFSNELLSWASKEIQDTLTYYDQDFKSVVEEKEQGHVACRSDLTLEVLSKASEIWSQEEESNELYND